MTRGKCYPQRYGRIKNPYGRPTPTGRKELFTTQIAILVATKRQRSHNAVATRSQRDRNAVATRQQRLSRMNNTMTEDEIRDALDSIARDYQPDRQRFSPLLKYKNQIQELRSHRASFETIAKYLKKFSIQTTGETIRRFYRLVIEQKPLRRKRRGRRKALVKKRNAKVKPTSPPKGWSIGQPRIANVNDL